MKQLSEKRWNTTVGKFSFAVKKNKIIHSKLAVFHFIVGMVPVKVNCIIR